MALALIDRAGVRGSNGRWPVVSRYPLPCFVIAGLLKAFGPGPTSAAWSNGLAISLLAALCYMAARRWYGPRWAALAGLCFVANPAFYGEFILLGTPDVWFATLFVAQVLLFSRLDLATPPPARIGWAFGVGLLGGLAYLARFNATLFLGVELGVLLIRRRRVEAGVMTLTVLVLATPHFLDNWRHFHRPVISIYSTWNLLDGVGPYRVEPWLYYRVPDVGAEVRAHAQRVVQKFATNLLTVVPVRVWSLWRLDLLLPLGLVAPVVLRGEARVRRFALWSVGLLALQLIVFSALRLELDSPLSPHHGRYFFWFAGPAILMGVGVLRWAKSRFTAGSGLVAVVVICQLALFGTTWRDLLARQPGDTNIGTDPIREVVTRCVGPDHVIASNQPQITAWFCGLRSISLPADPAELARLNRESPTAADYVFVDTNYNCIELDRRWQLIANQRGRLVSPWEAELLRTYEYVLPPTERDRCSTFSFEGARFPPARPRR
jgi:hypothetical protein